MPNRLIHETSPYLLQHAHNPVDWYAWGEEALARSRAEDKPILLSIGYSACHWCHVMEHESFENDETASIMNERFVSIKVDREERPDLDQIYMTAVQGMTRQGGWPMTVFLTPEGKPFFGGTYFPPTDRMGMPSFRRVLLSVSDMYRREREQVEEQAERVADFIRQQALINAPAPSLDPSILDDAFNALAGQFDLTHGGFGGAPKFPQAMSLEFLLRHHARGGSGASLQMVETTLQRMGHGGIYDQIGGGFHRYSVDARWLVPHFEKMLYDNALLARAYLHAYQVTGTPFYRRIAEETLDYVKHELRHEGGGFFSTQDADSEGVEGKYYVWTPREIEDAVGREDAPIVCSFYGVTEHGNFEGKNILTFPADAAAVASQHGLAPETIARARAGLLRARGERVPPGRDEKVLAAWNGLMLRSFAESARALGRAEDLATAEAAAAFLLREMWRDGQLLRVHRDGQTKIAGYLEDYGAVAAGLLALYEASFDLRWFVAAQEMAAAMVERFWDNDEGCFFDTAREAELLVARPRDPWDNATPSGTSLACDVLLRLWAYTGSSDYEGRARAALQGMGGLMRQQGSGLGNLLCALDFYLGPPREIAVIGNRDDPATAGLLAPLARAYAPNAVVAFAEPHDTEASAAIPLLAGRGLVDGKPTAYVCTGFVCDLPSTTPEDLVPRLGRPHT